MTEQSQLQPVFWSEVLTRRYLPKILLLCAAIWLHAANSMLAATTLPAAVVEIGGMNLVSWAFSLYLTASVVAGTAMSLCVTTYGLRNTMIGATLIYICGSAICGLAITMPIFLVGRLAQGIGGGGLVALVYLAQDQFFPNRYVPRIVACLSMVWMISAFCGPLVGGTFATLGIWRVAFAVFALQAVILLIAIPHLVPTEKIVVPQSVRRLPVLQLCCLTLAILLISKAGSSFDTTNSLILVGAAAFSLWLFVTLDKRSGSSRMLPDRVTNLGHPIGSGLLMTLSLSIALMSFLVYGPILLIRLYNLTPLSAGFILMLEAFAWGVAAIVFSGVGQEREQLLIKCGNFLVLAGLLANAIIVPNGPLWLLIVSVAISNFGFGMMWGHIIRRIINNAPESEKKKASAVLPAMQQTGFAMGAAFAGLIANGIGISVETTLPELRTIAFWLFAGFIPIALIGNCLAWKFVRAEP